MQHSPACQVSCFRNWHTRSQRRPSCKQRQCPWWRRRTLHLLACQARVLWLHLCDICPALTPTVCCTAVQTERSRGPPCWQYKGESRQPSLRPEGDAALRLLSLASPKFRNALPSPLLTEVKKKKKKRRMSCIFVLLAGAGVHELCSLMPHASRR